MDYGSDGLAYCTSCVFYGINKPCFRCRMYLPSSELQQYKGQWVCPYCIADMRTEDRAIETAGRKEERRLEGISEGENCERCGRSVSTVYYVRGMKLCGSCAEDSKKEWKEIGGERPPMPMYRVKEKAMKEAGLLSFINSIFSEFLALFGIKKKAAMESEIVALAKVARRSEKRPTRFSEAEKKEEREPMIEGPEKKERKKAKKSQDVSFSEFKPEENEKKKKKFVDFKND